MIKYFASVFSYLGVWEVTKTDDEPQKNGQLGRYKRKLVSQICIPTTNINKIGIRMCNGLNMRTTEQSKSTKEHNTVLSDTLVTQTLTSTD